MFSPNLGKYELTAKASVPIISSYQRWNMRMSNNRVFLLIEKRLYIPCNRCLLVNEECPFGILSRIMFHGRNMAENFVNKNIHRQQCRVEEQHTE